MGMNPMNVEVLTLLSRDGAGYVVSVVVDGKGCYTLPATPLSVARVRNACINRWCHQANRVTAPPIPPVPSRSTFLVRPVRRP